MTENQLRRRLQRMKESGMITRGNKLQAANNKKGVLGLFPGEEVEAPSSSGKCLYRETAVPLSTMHGSLQLQSSLECTAAPLKLLMNDPPEKIHPREGVFLDLETTGLAGGTGTWAFLVGMGWYEDNRFRVRQYFLRQPPEEAALLEHFTGAAREFNTLITFNGKSFDIPLLQDRMIMGGIRRGLFPELHIDLFHCCRRMWKNCLPECSLTSLEENLLGFHRSGDIPGEEIPQVYFNYLRRRETGRLKQVFEHNLHDIISLAALLGLIGNLETEDFIQNASPDELYSLGLLHWKYGSPDKAENLFHLALERGGENGGTSSKIMFSLAKLYKQQHRWESAARCWKILLQRGTRDTTPYVELAKIYEHRWKYTEEALRMTRQALQIALRRYQVNGDGREIPLLRHRLQRLEKKAKTSNICKPEGPNLGEV